MFEDGANNLFCVTIHPGPSQLARLCFSFIRTTLMSFSEFLSGGPRPILVLVLVEGRSLLLPSPLPYCVHPSQAFMCGLRLQDTNPGLP